MKKSRPIRIVVSYFMMIVCFLLTVSSENVIASATNSSSVSITEHKSEVNHILDYLNRETQTANEIKNITIEFDELEKRPDRTEIIISYIDSSTEAVKTKYIRYDEIKDKKLQDMIMSLALESNDNTFNYKYFFWGMLMVVVSTIALIYACKVMQF